MYKIKKLTITEDLGGSETDADFIAIFDSTLGLVIGDFNNDTTLINILYNSYAALGTNFVDFLDFIVEDN